MSETPNQRPRPWWDFRAGLIPSTLVTLFFASILGTSLTRLFVGPVAGWEIALAIAAALLTIAGLAVMARLARNRTR